MNRIRVLGLRRSSPRKYTLLLNDFCEIVPDRPSTKKSRKKFAKKIRGKNSRKKFAEKFAKKFCEKKIAKKIAKKFREKISEIFCVKIKFNKILNKMKNPTRGPDKKALHLTRTPYNAISIVPSSSLNFRDDRGTIRSWPFPL